MSNSVDPDETAHYEPSHLDLCCLQKPGIIACGRLIVLGFNDTSTLVGHFVSSPREREKSDRRDSRRDEREEQGRKRNRNESEETEEIKTFPLYPYLLQGQQALPNCKPISVGRPGDIRYTTPSHHPTTPRLWQ